jgi:lysophospholipase L1-like esterase
MFVVVAMAMASVKPALVGIGLMMASIAFILGAAEAAVRWFDGGALPSLPIFRQIDDGPIDLQENIVAWHRSGSRAVYPVITGWLGLRVASPGEAAPSSGDWLAIGDSQVFGQGVDGAATFAALATGKGVRIANAGVPGYGVEDALLRAEMLLPLLKPRGVLVVVNQANDWEEAGHPVQERFRVRGSWLLRRKEADAWEGAFMASLLSRSHILFYTAQLVHAITERSDRSTETPGWIAHAAEQEAMTLMMAHAIDDFAQRHDEILTIVCFLPVDFATGQRRAEKSPFRHLIREQRPWEDHELRNQLVRLLPAVPVVDMLPVLSNEPGFFLDNDYHLSSLGHEAVSAALVARIQSLEKAR